MASRGLRPANGLEVRTTYMSLLSLGPGTVPIGFGSRFNQILHYECRICSSHTYPLNLKKYTWKHQFYKVHKEHLLDKNLNKQCMSHNNL